MKTKSSLTPTQFRLWRKRLDWKRHEAAKKLGMSYGSIQHYEKGLRREGKVLIPRVVALAMIALEKLTHRDFSDWGLK